MQVLTRGLLLFAFATSACGGDETKKDGGLDGSSNDATANNDGAGIDSGWSDDAGGSKYIDVDGGKDCGIDAGPTYGQTWTCCNNSPCRGRCVIEPDAGGMPFCYCSGVAGGCPSPLVCCVNIIMPDGVCDSNCPSQGN